MFSISKKFKFFKKYDIFGCPVALTMKNEESYKTIFGGMLTVIINMFFLGVIVYSFFKLFTKQNLETAKYEINLGSTYGYSDLNSNNFMIAINFDQSVLNNWTLPFMNISLIHVTQFRNSSLTFKTKQKIPLKICNHSDFVGLESEFDQLGLNTALCPSPGFNLSLQGNFQENIFSYFQIQLTTCTNNKTCQNNKTIYNTISAFDKVNIQFFIINNIIDETNYEQPITRHIVSDMHFLIDPIKTVYRTADTFLSEVEITTDNGYTPTLISDVTPNRSYTYNVEFREQTIFTTVDVNSKVNIGNILTILSYLGGIWSTCYVAFMFLSNSYSRYFFINCLSNKLYNYPSQLKKKIPKKNTESEEGNQIRSPSLSPSQSPVSKNIYRKMIEKIETYLSYERKLGFSFCEMWRFVLQKLFWFIKIKDEKGILMDKSENNLMRDLDVCNILKKLHELDKIKNLLFSEEQQMMLGFSPKPEIISSEVDPSILEMTSIGIKGLSKSIKRKSVQKIKKKNQRLLDDELNFDEIQPFKQLIFAWKTLKTTKQTAMNINENLVKMFGEEFSKIVDMNEEEMQLFCTQQKTAGKKFTDIVKALKKNDFDGTNEIKFSEFQNRAKSLHSENFEECAEEKGHIIIGPIDSMTEGTENKNSKKMGSSENKSQLKRKLTNIKQKLGLNFVKQTEDSQQIELELVGSNEEISEKINSVPRESMFDNNTARSMEKSEAPLIKKNKKVFKSTQIYHENDEVKENKF